MMNEWIYALVGLAVAWLSQRLGLRLPNTRPTPPANPVFPNPANPLPSLDGNALQEIIRQVLLEVLRGIATPKTDDEVRKHMKTIVQRFGE